MFQALLHCSLTLIGAEEVIQRSIRRNNTWRKLLCRRDWIKLHRRDSEEQVISLFFPFQALSYDSFLHSKAQRKCLLFHSSSLRDIFTPWRFPRVCFHRIMLLRSLGLLRHRAVVRIAAILDESVRSEESPCSAFTLRWNEMSSSFAFTLRKKSIVLRVQCKV